MSKAVRLRASPRTTTAPRKSEPHPLFAIAIFSGLGLLVTLVAIIMGMDVAWY